MNIVVIGAGVIGASIAAQAAEVGAEVTLIDRATPGSGTTSTSYAWVNANGKEPESYFRLNAAGVQAHHELAGEGAPWLVAGGHLEVAVDKAHRRHLESRVSRMRERDYPVEKLSRAQVKEMVPDLAVPANSCAHAYFPTEAHVYPHLYLAHMLHRARAAGASVVTGAEVTALEADGERARVRTADDRTFTADLVVSAVGRWTNALTQLAGAPVPMAEFTEPGDVTVGYLATTTPVPVTVERLITTPWLNIRPAGGGRLMIQALDVDVTADPREVPAPDSPLADTLLRRLREVLPGTDGCRLEQLMVGQRAMPADGRTVVGRAPGHPWLYVVATHSGVTLAPLLGDAVVRELLGETEPLFEDFRPDRFEEGAPAEPPRGPRKPGEQ